MKKVFFILLLACQIAGCAQKNISSNQDPGKPIAFPGAEGFGKHATGGRGGAVYIVTNLNDSGPGSLREAIKKKGPRIITFTISGTIALESELAINNDDLTIAGQTAPGDGICIRNYEVKISANNVIIRYVRFRLGDEASVQGDAFGGMRSKDIIIDHCSISWATDECATFYYNENFTMQWCIISESLNSSVHEKGDHGYGGIWGGRNASFHHNLLAHHNSRLPRFSGSSTTPNSAMELVDFRNNVIYNWMQNNTYGGEKGKYNIVNNYYKPGPATRPNRKNRILNPLEPYGKFYVDGNYLVGDEDISINNWKGIIADSVESLLIKTPFQVDEIHMHSSIEAYQLILDFSGASLKRDKIDERIISEVSKGLATYGKNKDGIIDSQQDVGGWPELKSLAAPIDSDQDGMPDDWEKRNKLNPNLDDSSLHSLSKMYSNIEVYLDEIVRRK